MASIIPHFNMRQVLDNYRAGLYRPAAQGGQALAAERCAGARALAGFKEKVGRAWPRVALRQLDKVPERLDFGGRLRMHVAAFLNDLEPQDVRVELVLRRVLPAGETEPPPYTSFTREDGARAHGAVLEFFAPTGQVDSEGSHEFAIDCAPPWCGRLDAQVRIVPHHALLSHPYEMGMMKWL
jgi:starch phosphorylase